MLHDSGDESHGPYERDVFCHSPAGGQDFLARVRLEEQIADLIPMQFPHTNRQSQQDHSQIAKSQRLNQARHIFSPNLPLSPRAGMLDLRLRLALRLGAEHRVLVRGGISLAFQQLQP